MVIITSNWLVYLSRRFRRVLSLIGCAIDVVISWNVLRNIRGRVNFHVAVFADFGLVVEAGRVALISVALKLGR